MARLAVYVIASLPTRVVGSNLTLDNYLYGPLCDPQITVTSLDIILCPLLVYLFTPDVDEIPYIGRCHKKYLRCGIFQFKHQYL